MIRFAPARRAVLAAFAAAALAAPAAAQDLDKVHFLIPGGAGGGWDGTARGTGEALTKAGIVGDASYENMSGGGGGQAIAHLIELDDPNMIMVNSTPIIIRALQKVFPQSFRDLTPIAGTIGDYAALVVNSDSPIQSFEQLQSAYQASPNEVAIGGGSVAGGMDHVVAAIIMKAAGENPLDVKYIPYDAGGKAMAGLLSGEIKALSTGYSEAVALAQQGEVRILCVTADARVDLTPDVPTCAEVAGPDAKFVNWRGFFGGPGMSDEQAAAYVAAFEKMYDTPEWEEVRARNGWVEIWNPGAEFSAYLEAQEKQIGDLMRELGFL